MALLIFNALAHLIPQSKVESLVILLHFVESEVVKENQSRQRVPVVTSVDHGRLPVVSQVSAAGVQQWQSVPGVVCEFQEFGSISPDYSETKEEC